MAGERRFSFAVSFMTLVNELLEARGWELNHKHSCAFDIKYFCRSMIENMATVRVFGLIV